MHRTKICLSAAYGLLLAAFTVFLLLDTFVIPHVYSNAENRTESAYEPLLSAGERLGDYNDGVVSIRLTAYRCFDSDVFIAEVWLSSPDQLKTALAKEAYGRNLKEQPSVMAERNHAILAVNGDYYGAQEKGYVLRNGSIYRTTGTEGQEDLVIYRDGTFGIIEEQRTTLQTLQAYGAAQALSFGPALMKDGVVSVQESDLRGKDRTRNPRTAIGCIDALHYVFVVADGRTDASDGPTIPELAEVMACLGAQTAYNLDGGGSSCMVFDGEVVNHPTTTGNRTKEREVSGIVYIGF